MTWWRNLRREPPPPRGRRHRGTPPDPAALTERLSGMLATYVPTGEEAAARQLEPAAPVAYRPAPAGEDHAGEQAAARQLEPAAPVAYRPAPAGEDVAAVAGAGTAPADTGAPAAEEVSAGAEGPGTVVLGFADGSTVALEPSDSRTRPFLTLTDALTSR